MNRRTLRRDKWTLDQKLWAAFFGICLIGISFFAFSSVFAKKTLSQFSVEVSELQEQYEQKAGVIAGLESELDALHAQADAIRAECSVEHDKDNCDFSQGVAAPLKTAKLFGASVVHLPTVPQAAGSHTYKAQQLAKVTSFNNYYTLKNGGYKNDRIADLQDYASSVGVEQWKHKYLIGWLLTENGALSENVLGDGGMSAGLCQCHRGYRKCAAKGDYAGQRKQCVDWFVSYTKDASGGNILSKLRRGHNSLAYWYEGSISKQVNRLAIAR